MDSDPAARHSLDLLLGVKTTSGTRETRLLKARGTVVVWQDPYAAIGVASELAHYLLSNLYGNRNNLSVARGVMLASQVLHAAKQYGQGCGGPSDILQLRLGWVADFVHEDDIALHENSADRFAEIVRPVMLAVTDIYITSAQLDDIIGRMQVELHSYQSRRADALPTFPRREARAGHKHPLH